MNRTERTCLKCGKPFPSDGPGNRICNICGYSNKKEYERDQHGVDNGRVVRKAIESDNFKVNE